jgi:hypothetical protein
VTLIVEDGSVVPGAESYISVADADTYHANRGNAAWADFDDDAKEGYLRNATDAMIQMYRLRWKGSRMEQAQVLDFPRGYLYLQPFIKGALYPYGTFPYMLPNNVVPDLVKNACAELALRAASGPLLSDLSQVVEREQIGPISVNYSKYSPQQKRYASIDAMLAEFLLPGGSASTALVRV